ncbi:6141_t:CDS:2, partial [Ambispora gerdemannii]
KQSRWYTCSLSFQRDHTVLNSKRIHTKQEHFTCHGLLRLILNPENMIMHLHLRHHELHSRPATKENVYFWWSTFHQKLFYHDNDQFTSAIYLLQEDESYLLLYSNQENGLFEFAFTTPFLQLLHGIYDEICMDATYKTNNVRFELYTVMVNIEGVGYPLSYLFLNSSPTTPNMRTIALTDYLYAL